MTQPGNDLERELRQALRRKEPSAGFAARVLENLPEERHGRWSWRLHAPVVRWAAAAAVLMAVAGGSVMYREHQQELERGRIAKQQLMVALRITGAKLQLAQHRTLQIGTDRAAGSPVMEKE